VPAPVPAPTEGWDAISPLAAMDPKRAPILVNWTPRPGWVELRGGSNPWAIVPGNGPVETIMVYRGPNATQKMFAASNHAIYDVSTSGSPTTPASPIVTGLSNNRFQYVQFTPALGDSYLQMVNGANSLVMYDGVTGSWTQPSIGGLPFSATTANISNIYAQKRRLWYMIANSTTAAFMPTDAISGPIAGTQDFGALWTRGGFIVAMADWTEDGGNGPSDYAAFISSRGQVSIFSGTDPTNAAAWQLVGTFNISPPIGLRCMTQLGADVGVITLQGVLPLSQVLPFDPSADRSAALTARIQNAMATATAQAQFNFGWQLITFPAQQLIVLNVPLTTNSQQVQFVQNALTGAWTQFVGWNANCFELFNDNLYFGDNNGIVWEGYAGQQDGSNPVKADMQCAFNWFGQPGRTKRMTMIQPLVVAQGIVQPTLSVDADFSNNAPSAPVTVLQGGSLWDVAQWDVGTWPVTSTVQTSWYSAEVLGHALAVRMQVNIAATSIGALGVFDLSEFDMATFDSGNPDNVGLLQVNAFNTILELGGYV
jgi:hypothetical protein